MLFLETIKKGNNRRGDNKTGDNSDLIIAGNNREGRTMASP
jgi:hypothetical protein